MSAFSLPFLTISHQFKLSFPSSSNLSTPFSTPSRKFTPPSILCSSANGPKPLRASTSESASATTEIVVENSESDDSTVFVIRARNRIGLLQVVTRVFKVLGLLIDKASVEFEGDFFVKRFFVTDSHGNKVEDEEGLERIKNALMDAIGGDGTVSVGPATRGVVVRRPGLGMASEERSAKAERMFALMDKFQKNDPISLQKDILDHVEYTVARSRFSFDDFEAYQVLWVGFLLCFCSVKKFWFESIIFSNFFGLLLILLELSEQRFSTLTKCFCALILHPKKKKKKWKSLVY